MGANLALQANEKKIAVIGKARSKKPELEKRNVKVVDDYQSFVDFLETSESDLSLIARWSDC